VVEADLDVREALCALLERWGHDVANVAEGHLAVLVAGRYTPEVVLLDLGLPDIDGFEVAIRLRAAATGERLFLVALTGDADKDVTRIQACRFDAYLMKPPDPDELERLLAGVPAAIPPTAERAGPSKVAPPPRLVARDVE